MRDIKYLGCERERVLWNSVVWVYISRESDEKDKQKFAYMMNHMAASKVRASALGFESVT